MARNTVRALCALITLELDPKKVEVLIEELTTVLLGDYMPAQGGSTRDADRELKLPTRSALVCDGEYDCLLNLGIVELPNELISSARVSIWRAVKTGQL